MFIFNFNPTKRNELNYFCLCNPINIYGVKFGVSSCGLNIYFFKDKEDKINTPKEVFTANYFEFIIIIFLTSTYNFILISDTYV